MTLPITITENKEGKIHGTKILSKEIKNKVFSEFYGNFHIAE